MTLASKHKLRQTTCYLLLPTYCLLLATYCLLLTAYPSRDFRVDPGGFCGASPRNARCWRRGWEELNLLREECVQEECLQASCIRLRRRRVRRVLSLRAFRRAEKISSIFGLLIGRLFGRSLSKNQTQRHQDSKQIDQDKPKLPQYVRKFDKKCSSPNSHTPLTRF